MTGNIDMVCHTLDWILRDSETGFYLLVASEQGQARILSQYADKNVCVYDVKKKAGNYRFADVSDWVEENPGKKLYILQNLHLALGRYETCQNFNFTRDMLRRLQKNFLFCVTPLAEDRLNRWALDFCGYLKLKLFCEEEVEKRPTKEKPPVIDRSTHIPPPEVDLNGDKEKLLTQAITWENQVITFYEDGRYEDALTLLDAARKIREHFLGESHPNLASTYLTIGAAFSKKAELDVALHWYIKALTIASSPNHLSSIYNNIGSIYDQKSLYSISLEWYQKSLKLSESLFNSNHPQNAITYCNIGNVYSDKGDYISALKWQNKALTIMENSHGANHPDTALFSYNIGDTHLRRGDYDTALDCLKKAESAQEYVLPKGHPDTINTYQAIAEVYESKGDTIKQQEYLQKIESAKGETP